MPWDDELTHLSQGVRDTFGEDAWQGAVNRALVVLIQARPEDVEAPFTSNTVCQEALKVEFRRLLQPH
jgi:hypothetical protein